jgi:hypothetical protein
MLQCTLRNDALAQRCHRNATAQLRKVFRGNSWRDPNVNPDCSTPLLFLSDLTILLPSIQCHFFKLHAATSIEVHNETA